MMYSLAVDNKKVHSFRFDFEKFCTKFTFKKAANKRKKSLEIYFQTIFF